MQHLNNSVMALGTETPEPVDEADARDSAAEWQRGVVDAPEPQALHAAGPAVRLPWHVEVSLLLSRAAALCGEHGIDIDSFTSGAWAAYVEATPGMRAQLEELQLRKQLDELRELGRLPSA